MHKTRIDIVHRYIMSVMENSFQAADLCETDLIESEGQFLEWCAGLLIESPTGGAFLKEAAETEWRIGLTDMAGSGYNLDIPSRTLLLDSHGLSGSALGQSVYFRHAVMTAFVRGLRDIWHENRHGGFERNHRAENVLTLERVRAADCDMMAVYTAWELRGSGHGDMWRHIIGSEDGDIAMIFTRFMESEPAAMFNARALQCAFSQWYEDDTRVNACDHETLEYLDGFAGNPAPALKGERTIAAGPVIEELSTLPDGRRYLFGYTEKITDDPYFSAIRDAMNQAHLTHLLDDLNSVTIGHVSMRDARLAALLFPPDAEGQSVN